jgi:hypothetical protein
VNFTDILRIADGNPVVATALAELNGADSAARLAIEGLRGRLDQVETDIDLGRHAGGIHNAGTDLAELAQYVGRRNAILGVLGDTVDVPAFLRGDAR